jgi:hypothetical protein
MNLGLLFAMALRFAILKTKNRLLELVLLLLATMSFLIGYLVSGNVIAIALQSVFLFVDVYNLIRFVRK